MSADKWAVLKALTDGREAFGLTDRNLSVLSALLSFHPSRDLTSGALTVFPSNASLSERLHGMPESTLRRHLSALVDAGMIHRQDSPNGKRYATRDGKGQIDRIFGFDLRPLLLRAAEINDAAVTARERSRLIRRTRQTIALLLRDAMQLPAYAAEDSQTPDVTYCSRLAELQKVLRRKLDLASLSGIETALRELLSSAEILCETPGLSGNDSQNERHLQNTNSEPPESENAEEKDEDTETVPLPIVLKAAPEMATYTAEPIQSWHDLFKVADFVCPMMGITKDTWQLAQRCLGQRKAAVTLACILQRFSKIQKPGAYLRRLATTENFHIGPMVMALLRHDDLVRG